MNVRFLAMIDPARLETIAAILSRLESIQYTVTTKKGKPGRYIFTPKAEETAVKITGRYVYSQYAECESKVCFHLNEKGRAAGIDAMSLSTGPVWRVKKYGSEELKTWFAVNGWHTLSSF